MTGVAAGIPVMFAIFTASAESGKAWTDIDWQGIVVCGAILGDPRNPPDPSA